MQRLEVSGAVRPIYGSLGVKRLMAELNFCVYLCMCQLLLWQIIWSGLKYDNSRIRVLGCPVVGHSPTRTEPWALPTSCCQLRTIVTRIWPKVQDIWTKYEGESNENLKSSVKILNTARLSFKLTTVILMVWRVADRWQYDAGMQHDGAVVL